MHHLHPTRHANTAPIHPRDGGRRNGSGPKFPSPDLRDQLLSSLTTPISISASDSNDIGQYAATSSTGGSGRMAQIWVQSTYFLDLRFCARIVPGKVAQQQIRFPFPPHQGGVDAAQAGIRKDGRINPDTNPGGNVSDVGRWKLGDIRSLGSPANGQEKLQQNFEAHVKIFASYCM